MSAPRTNLEKQKKRHRGPLVGIQLSVGLVLVLLLLWLGWVFFTGTDPGDEPQPGDVPAAVGQTNGN